MKEGKFIEVAVKEGNPNWSKLTERNGHLYNSPGDIRNDFSRDYTRVLHSFAFRRLKHKTQVFFNGAGNDHVCTRMEHVLHVESVATTIASNLGLNLDLVRAIATAHDLGHAPFGHHGESILTKKRKFALGKFWHEQNGLYFVDNIELLQDHFNKWQNLNLTYAVRDGIISHCGEVDTNGLKPRTNLCNLYDFKEAGTFESATWEGCVVKLADKIAYLGRDIEDARTLGYFGPNEIKQLEEMSKRCMKDESINTSTIMHNLIINLCENSSPEKGLRFSDDIHEQLKEIKTFNYKHIYNNKRLDSYKHYAELVITEIWNTLFNLYQREKTLDSIAEGNYLDKKFVKMFCEWLAKYCDPSIITNEDIKETIVLSNYENIKIYRKLEHEHIYAQAISDYIAGMTDVFAVESFNELLKC